MANARKLPHCEILPFELRIHPFRPENLCKTLMNRQTYTLLHTRGTFSAKEERVGAHMNKIHLYVGLLWTRQHVCSPNERYSHSVRVECGCGVVAERGHALLAI